MTLVGRTREEIPPQCNCIASPRGTNSDIERAAQARWRSHRIGPICSSDSRDIQTDQPTHHGPRERSAENLDTKLQTRWCFEEFRAPLPRFFMPLRKGRT